MKIDNEHDQIFNAIINSWRAETSFDPDSWTIINPEYGQCAVTALVVQDILGGEIYRCVYYDGKKKGSHYFNVLGDKIVDLTQYQFTDTVVFTFPQIAYRDHMLVNKNTKLRYENLKNIVTQKLQR